MPTAPAPRLAPLVAAGLLMGLGFGGLVDGIVFHQILLWHHLVCTHDCKPATVQEFTEKARQDGAFDACTLAVALAGVVLLHRAGRRPGAAWSGRALAGATVGGWGVFNVVEGSVDHLLLQIHHVRPGPSQGTWDLTFLLAGLFLAAAGFLMVRTTRAAMRPDPAPPARVA